MASPKPYASVSTEESSEVRVSDSDESLLVTGSSSGEVSPVVSARVLDSIEPLVQAAPVSPVVSARVLDSIEPLVPASAVNEPTAGPSGVVFPRGSTRSIMVPASSSSSDEDDVVPAVPASRPSGSSGRRVGYYAQEIRDMWNWRRVFEDLGTHEQCVQFAEDRGLVPTLKMCTQHKVPMKVTKENGQLGRFRCRKAGCRTKPVSRAKGTWFENARLALVFIFQVMYAFSQDMSYNSTKNEVSSRDHDTVLSDSTINDWFNYCREVVTQYEIDHYQNAAGKIGGLDKVVQENLENENIIGVAR